MKPITVKYVAVGVARDNAELQALLREIADASGKSRDQIDQDGGLPDRFSSKALAAVPIGTCQLGAKTLGKMLKGVGVVLIVARITPGLNRAADSAVKRRDEQVRARLLSMDVYNAAKTRLASVNGKLRAKAYLEFVPPEKRSRNARRAARIRWRKHRLAARKDPKLMEQVQLLPRDSDARAP
jgi:hypothetical protein